MATRKKTAKYCLDLMETIDRMLRPDDFNKDGMVEWKKGYSKKKVKRIKKSCVHWKLDKKGRPVPAVELIIDGTHSTGMVKCRICGAVFPVYPFNNPNEYAKRTSEFEELVNQIEYLDMESGGSKENTIMFTTLKSYLPRFVKVAERVTKAYKDKDRQAHTREAAKRGQNFGFHNGKWISTTF